MLPKTYTVAIVNINIVLALESDKRTGASPAKFLLVFKILFPEATILYNTVKCTVYICYFERGKKEKLSLVNV